MKAGARFSRPDNFVFGTKRGTQRDRNTLRTRILYPAIERPNAKLAKARRPPIPAGVTFHSLRRTYASLIAEAGADPRYTMRQIGHTRAEFTLAVYTDVGDRKHAANGRLGAMLLGDWAVTGSETVDGLPTSAADAKASDENEPALQALSEWS